MELYRPKLPLTIKFIEKTFAVKGDFDRINGIARIKT